MTIPQLLRGEGNVLRALASDWDDQLEKMPSGLLRKLDNFLVEHSTELHRLLARENRVHDFVYPVV